MAEDQVSGARETLAALVLAARSAARDPAGHPRRAETFEKLATKATAFGERWGELQVNVQPKALVLPQGAKVHEDTAEGPPLAASLAAAGVKALTLGSGVAREELQALVEVVSRAGRGDEDVVSALWRAGLWAVTLEADDDVDQRDPVTAAEVVSLIERIEDERQKARTPREGALSANPPEGRDFPVETPPPAPISIEDSKAQLEPWDLVRRSVEVLRTALWRKDAPVPPELGAKLGVEVVRRVLASGDLALAADLLDRLDPAEAPAAAVKAAEKVVATVGPELVRAVPVLYLQRVPQGEDQALALALRCLEHLDTAGVQAAAASYASVPWASRRPLRRVLSARGNEALEGIIRIADHKAFEVSRDGLAMLALVPLDGARKALQKFVDDPTTPKERLDLARGALGHWQQNAAKAGVGSRANVSQQLCANLRDPSYEKRVAAARSLAKLPPDPQTYSALEQLVTLPGFPNAEAEEQKALLEALAASGPDKAGKVLDALVQRTLGLPANKVARAVAEAHRKARGSARA